MVGLKGEREVEARRREKGKLRVVIEKARAAGMGGLRERVVEHECLNVSGE